MLILCTAYARKVTIETLYMALHLYHGTSMGWLKHIGFSKAMKPFGEFTNTHNFVYLASNREGAETAAIKATIAAKGRLSKGLLTPNDFVYNGIQYTPQECVYTVEVNEKVRVFDFANELLDKADAQLLRRALWVGRKSLFGYCSSFVKATATPRTWVRTLDRAITINGETSLGRRVQVLSQAGADLIKNAERDSDGQNYGVVYALPLDKLDCVTILQCA